MNLFCNFYVYLFLFIVNSLVICHTEEVRLNTAHLHRQTSEHFLGLAIDAIQVKHHWEEFSLAMRSTKFHTLALALSPGFLRFGGTSSDFLIFKESSAYNETRNQNVSQYFFKAKAVHHPGIVPRSVKEDEDKWFDWDTYYLAELKKDLSNFTMTGEMFDSVFKFVEFVGWNMTFDLNVLRRKQGSWDPTNAVELIDYTVKRGYRLAGWELGNEPNSFYHLIKLRLSPEQLAQDYIQLKKILSSYRQYEDCIILGPSVTQLNKRQVNNFFQTFLTSGGADVVTAATFHQYYLTNHSATQAAYTDPSVFNLLIPEVATGVRLIQESGSRAQLWIGETSTAIGSLQEPASLTYRAGFMWLDKLGVTAKGGVDVVIRQSFYGGINSLIDRDKLKPRPDYWLTVLYKLLVGSKVLAVSSPSSTGSLRAYAHCTATAKSGYRRGSVVVYVINLYSSDRSLTFPDLGSDQTVHMYSMTPKHGSLDSRTVLLNGTPLEMVDDSTLPNLIQPVKTTAPVIIPGLTYAFYVFPDVNLQICW